MKRYFIMLVLLSVFLLLSACAETSITKESQPVLTVLTHDSFTVSETVVKIFEEEQDVKLVFLKSGDAGAALNRAILTKGNPEADVFFGVDNTFLSRAVREGIFEPYTSPALAGIPAEFTGGLAGLVTPIDYGDVCINYDKTWFAERGLSVPQTLDELAKPAYKGEGGVGLLVVENPATSSPGLAFLLATIAEYGEAGYLDYWRLLKQNNVVVVNDWETAYYTNFSASSGRGLQPMVVSYATSPAAEVIFAAEPLREAPTASITGVNTCFRQVEYAGILKGSGNIELAQRFIDYMLSLNFQQDIPLQMFMFPVNSAAVLPDEFVRYASRVEEPARLDPVLISNRRDEWIAAWSRVMLP